MIPHSFLTTAPQQADVAGNILLFCFVLVENWLEGKMKLLWGCCEK
jgi:hypothetical protein